MAKKPESDVVTGVDKPAEPETADGSEPDAADGETAEAEADVVVEAAETVEETVTDPTPVGEAPFGWDVIGEDGRRVVRGVPEAEARAVAARILANGSDEELAVVPAGPPVDHLSYPEQG